MRTLLLTLTTCLLVLPVQAKYSGGTGEPNDPYQIATAEDLILLGETTDDYDKHFILTADIDLDPNLPGRMVFDRAAIAADMDAAKWDFQGTRFTGSFNGGNHTISHLTIKGVSYLGLFGYSGWGAVVKQLGVVDVNITGSGDHIGALGNAGTVTQCYSTGTVSGTGLDVGGLLGIGSATECYSTATVTGGNYVGGLVGTGVATRCYSTGAVSGDQCVGGLVGLNLDGIVADSYSTGTVSGQSRVGGLVGGNGNAEGFGPGIVTRCHSTAMVSGKEDVGGLVGYNEDGIVAHSYSTGTVSATGQQGYVGGLVGRTNSGGVSRESFSHVTHCYSTAVVCGTGVYGSVGGLVGQNGGDVSECYSSGVVSGKASVGGLVGSRRGGAVSACFWDVETSGQATSASGVGKTTAEMKTAKTFLDAGWDFVGETANGSADIWKIAEGVGYPRLSWQKYSGGTGEPNDPYQIATAADLIALGETPEDYDKHFILTADIDLDPNLPGRKVFDKAVIAPDTDQPEYPFPGTPFAGVFDGNGHVISHLTITGGNHLGLFGSLEWGEVGNLGIVDADVHGSGDFIGALIGLNGDAGLAGGATVRGCYSTGAVHGDQAVAGLIGVNAGTGCIIQCYSACSVSGRSVVGGLVGYIEDGSVSQSYSTGSVSGTERYAGGLVGAVAGCLNIGIVTHCYSSGSVQGGGDYVGGLVGNVACSGIWGIGIVTHCYSSGSVQGGGDYVGGLVGSNFGQYGEGTVTASFWDIETSGQTASAGGTGKTTTEMQTAKTFVDAGWDFVGETANGTEDIWKIAEGLDYPRLWWEPYDGRVTVVLGQIFTVTLEANPSTGYRWEWVDHQDSIVEQMGEAQFKPRETGDPPLVGAGGWESFDFKAVKQGQMTLKLVYRRPWEEGVEPLKTFSLQVTVP